MSAVVSIHPKGTAFVRVLIARAVAGASGEFGADEFAVRQWGPDSAPALILKAAVAGGGTDGWGGELSAYATARAEFFSLIRANSIAGRLTGLRRVPAKIPIINQVDSARAHWVGEGEPAPMSAGAFARTVMESRKVIAMLVATLELLQDGGAEGETILRNDLIEAAREALDSAFIDPANIGSADTPASITHDAAAVASTGVFTTDAKALVAGFAGDLDRAFFVGHPKLFAQINGVEHPNIGARGGEILGTPALPSKSVPTPGDKYQLALIDPTGIAYTENDVELRASTHASVQMVDNPVGDGSGTLVSLWQVNAAALGAAISTNWQVVRPSVSLLTGIEATA